MIPEAKRSLLDKESINVAHKMMASGNSVPEIRKTLGGRDGDSILSYDDIRNWRVEKALGCLRVPRLYLVVPEN